MGFPTDIEPLLQHLKVTDGLDHLPAIAGYEGTKVALLQRMSWEKCLLQRGQYVFLDTR